jgi:ribosomal-protein-alanine N-acetyltransferase
MTEFFARRIATWTYTGEWSVYNLSPENVLFTGEAGYVAVVGSEGTLVGFACEGIEARVPGLHQEIDTVDVGYGMNPIFVGQGHGFEFGTVVTDHFGDTLGANRLRVAVQSWNERSLKLAKSLGFVKMEIHECVQNGSLVTYTILLKTFDCP